jgi:hypothetical protein
VNAWTDCVIDKIFKNPEIVQSILSIVQSVHCDLIIYFTYSLAYNLVVI